MQLYRCSISHSYVQVNRVGSPDLLVTRRDCQAKLLTMSEWRMPNQELVGMECKSKTGVSLLTGFRVQLLCHIYVFINRKYKQTNHIIFSQRPTTCTNNYIVFLLSHTRRFTQAASVIYSNLFKSIHQPLRSQPLDSVKWFIAPGSTSTARGISRMYSMMHVSKFTGQWFCTGFDCLKVWLSMGYNCA